jgi:SOS-response transcriptional repressor LexA
VSDIEELHARATRKLYRTTLQNVSSEARGWFIGVDHDNIPEYLPLDFCIIDPAVKPSPGQMGVFRIARWNRNLFRRYTVDGYLPNGQPRIVLEALNPAVEATVINDQNPCEVIGTLVSHERNMLLG